MNERQMVKACRSWMGYARPQPEPQRSSSSQSPQNNTSLLEIVEANPPLRFLQLAALVKPGVLWRESRPGPLIDGVAEDAIQRQETVHISMRPKVEHSTPWSWCNGRHSLYTVYRLADVLITHLKKWTIKVHDMIRIKSGALQAPAPIISPWNAIIFPKPTVSIVILINNPQSISSRSN